LRRLRSAHVYTVSADKKLLGWVWSPSGKEGIALFELNPSIDTLTLADLANLRNDLKERLKRKAGVELVAPLLIEIDPPRIKVAMPHPIDHIARIHCFNDSIGD